MSGKWHSISLSAIAGGDQNNIRKARSIRPIMKMIERGPKPEESNLSFQVFDLTLELFLSLISFLVTLLAGSGVAWPVILQTRQAIHHFVIGLTLCVRNGSGRHAPAAMHRKLRRRCCNSVKDSRSFDRTEKGSEDSDDDRWKITFWTPINYCSEEQNNLFFYFYFYFFKLELMSSQCGPRPPSTLYFGVLGQF